MKWAYPLGKVEPISFSPMPFGYAVAERLGRAVHVFHQCHGPSVIDRMFPVRLLHLREIGEGLFPVGVPVIGV